MRISRVLFATICLAAVLQFLILLAALVAQRSRGETLFVFVITTQSVGNLCGIWVAVGVGSTFRRLVGAVAIAALSLTADFLCQLEGFVAAYAIPILLQAVVTFSLLGVLQMITTPFGSVVFRETDLGSTDLKKIIERLFPHCWRRNVTRLARFPSIAAFTLFVFSLATIILVVPEDLVELFISREALSLFLAVAMVSPAVVLSVLSRGHVKKKLVLVVVIIAASIALLSVSTGFDWWSASALVLTTTFWMGVVLVVVRMAGYHLTWVSRFKERLARMEYLER